MQGLRISKRNILAGYLALFAGILSCDGKVANNRDLLENPEGNIVVDRQPASQDIKGFENGTPPTQITGAGLRVSLDVYFACQLQRSVESGDTVSCHFKPEADLLAFKALSNWIGDGELLPVALTPFETGLRLQTAAEPEANEVFAWLLLNIKADAAQEVRLTGPVPALWTNSQGLRISAFEEALQLGPNAVVSNESSVTDTPASDKPASTPEATPTPSDGPDDSDNLEPGYY